MTPPAFPDNFLKDLGSQAMAWNNYKAGEVIFREGEESDAAYLIVSGEVQVMKGYGTEEAKEVAVLRAGEYVGEMGAIDSEPRSASAARVASASWFAISAPPSGSPPRL